MTMQRASKIYVAALVLAALVLAAFALLSVERGPEPVPIVQTGTNILQAGAKILRHEDPLPKEVAAPVQAPKAHDAHVVVETRVKPKAVPAPQSDIRMVPVEKLLKETAVRERIKPVIAFGKPAKKREDDDVGVDIGRGLPLPMPDSALITPIDKPNGYHVGVDYHVDQKWDLTGLAGVTTTTGPVGLMTTTKPYINQIGFKASYRF